MIFWFSIVLLVSTCIKETLLTRKVWYAPLYALVNECLWVGYLVWAVPAGWPILAACGYYIYNYIRVTPKWYRGRLLR